MIFQHAGTHEDLYRRLLRPGRSLDLISNALDVGTKSICGAYEAHFGIRVPLEVAANHIIRSFADLIEWWLEQDMPYEPEHMGEIYRDLILKPTERVALRPHEISE